MAMKEIVIKNPFSRRHVVKLYDEIKEMPIRRAHEFNKLLLQDAGIGSDMESVGRHFSMFHSLIKTDKKAELMQEATNLHNNLFFIIQGLNIRSYCFASLVAEIDGRKYNDLSTSGAEKTVEALEKVGLRNEHVTDLLDELKKKLIMNLEPLFLVGLETPI